MKAYSVVLVSLLLGASAVGFLFFYHQPVQSGIYTQFSILHSDGSVTTYDPTISPLSAESISSVSGLKVCSWLVTSSSYGSYLLSMTLKSSTGAQNSTGLKSYPANSVSESDCASAAAPVSGKVTFSGSGFVAGLGTSSSVFQTFSQQLVSVILSGGQIQSATAGGIGGANSTTLVCETNCVSSLTTSIKSTASPTLTTFSLTTTSASSTANSQISTTLNGQSTILTAKTTDLVSAASSSSTAVISSTSLDYMGGASSLTSPSNLVCLDDMGNQIANGCYVYASTSTGYFYSQGVVGYQPDGSPIYAYAQLGSVAFAYSATFITYPQLQAAMTQYGSLLNYSKQQGNWCPAPARKLGGC